MACHKTGTACFTDLQRFRNFLVQVVDTAPGDKSEPVKNHEPGK